MGWTLIAAAAQRTPAMINGVSCLTLMRHRAVFMKLLVALLTE